MSKKKLNIQRRSSVALDEESYQISKRVGNFSAFVRECLRRWNAQDLGTHIAPTASNKCNPFSKKGACVICWPDGAPEKKDWFYYLETGGRVVVGTNNSNNPIFAHDQPYANDWIEQKAREANEIQEFQIPSSSRFSYSRKSPETLGVFAKVANFLRAKFQRSR